MHAGFPSQVQLQAGSGLAQVRVFDSLNSTQATAAELADAGELALPAAIVAQNQLDGRGRGTNRWWSGASALTVTFALPIDPQFPPQLLPLCVGVCVRESLLPWSRGRILLKWPNDLLIDNRKLAGILCERVRHADLVGIGINLFADREGAPSDVQTRAISLAEVSTTPPPFAEVFKAVARAVVAARGREDWHAAFNEHHALSDRRISIESSKETLHGICEGVDEEGRLLLRVGDSLRKVMSGTVRMNA